MGMAIQTDYLYHHGGSSSIWSCSDLAFDTEDSQGMDMISQSLLQGSISLGRYENEVLAWEKYSAFTHNRLQEEIEKFKEPGLVAQKKAYFEEHYRKKRSSKALQETTRKVEESCQILHTDNHNNPQRAESVNRLEQESEMYCEKDSVSVKQSVERDSPLSPSIRRCSDISLRVRVSRIECRLKKLSPVPKPKWSISSPKSKSDGRIRKDFVKAIEKPMLNALREITRGVDDDLVSTKSITPKAAKNTTSSPFSSHRLQKEVECPSTNTCPSFTKNKRLSLSSLSSSSSGSLLNGCLAEKQTTTSSSSVLIQSSQSLFVQSNSKEITNTVHLRKLCVDKRTSGVGVGKKFQESSSHHRRSNSGECKSPRPKTMTIKSLAENKSKQAIGPEVAERVYSPRLSKQKKENVVSINLS